MTLSDSEKARKLNVAVKDIKNAFAGRYGATRVWEPDSQQYRDSIRHSLGSSNREPAIVVEPDNAEDAATLLKVIAKHRVRFAIMGGGHATCPRFSSTKGVHISMRRLNSVEFLQNGRLVRAGAGCTWDEVYKALDKKKRIVVGGNSNKGVGIAGYLLGGGYSMKTNQYGLGIDNVTEFQVALPNGKLVIAKKSENRDLFEALRGGGNNFGIVTCFTIRTHPARNTYGAILTYKLSEAKKVKAAIQLKRS